MVREIIQFTKDLLEDIPDIMNWNNIPESGLYVFIDIDEQGNWTNKDLQFGVDYTYTNGADDKFPMSDQCKLFNDSTGYISMNKVKKFDPKQKIHSCSPFAVAFNFNFNKEDLELYKLKIDKKATEDEKIENDRKIREKRLQVIKERLVEYKKNSLAAIAGSDCYEGSVNAFFANIDSILETVSQLEEYGKLTSKDYLKVFLRSVPISEQSQMHNQYVESEILNGDILETNGVVGFFTAYDSKKTFLRHKTAYMKGGTNYRYTTADALMLDQFQILMKRKPAVLPKLLPIVVDKRELNKDIVKIFNDSEKPLTYREVIKTLFEKHRDMNYLQDFYLASFTNTKDGLMINDIDFVPLFRYRIDNCKIKNVMRVGYINDNKEFEEDPDKIIADIFDFERLVVSPIFNNSLVVIKQDEYKIKYWDEIKPEYVYGGDVMYQLILKYRKAIYDYIYKSKVSAISDNMFEDMMLQSILCDIKHDKVANPKRFSNNNKIKNKLNIWFSIDYLFNNNNIGC